MKFKVGDIIQCNPTFLNGVISKGTIREIRSCSYIEGTRWKIIMHYLIEFHDDGTSFSIWLDDTHLKFVGVAKEKVVFV